VNQVHAVVNIYPINRKQKEEEKKLPGNVCA